jgi:tetratricopeptide (TPR) repeat protein
MSDRGNQAPLPEGDFLGPYRIVSLLARGARWDVYLARSGGEQRQVALKTPAGDWADVPAQVLARATAAARLEHPNVARLYDAGLDRGRVFVAEELVADQRGVVTDLATEVLNHGHRLPEERVRVLAKHLLDGVAAIHQAGLAHGRLDAGKVLLSAQRRAKLVDAGLWSAGSAADQAADVRAVGSLIYQMLTGQPLTADAPPPQQFGAAPAWGSLIRALAAAQPGALPDLAALSEQVLTLDSGDSSPRRTWFYPVLAAGLLLVAAAVGGLVVKARRSAVERVHTASVARETAAREGQIGAFLAVAAAARDRGDAVGALDACRQALALDARHPAALKLQAECRTAAGVAQLGDAKERADSAWNTIREVHPGEGFADLLSDVRSVLTAARNALASQEYAQAATLFRQAADKATTVTQLDAGRREAAPAREEVETARDGAEGAAAPAQAPELWQQAEAEGKTGLEQFTARRFQEAVTTWRSAASLYGRAERKALGSRRLAAARSAFEKAVVAAGETSRAAMPADTKARVQALCDEGTGLAEREDWPTAVARWEAALQIFDEGMLQADAVLRRQHFDDALARARHTLSRNALAESEKLLSEALGITGFRDNDEAQRLLADVRARRLQAGETGPGREENLVLNGDFSISQTDAPVGWTRPDNLTVFWEEGGVHGQGKCLRMDTDVYRSEWEAHRKSPDTPVKKTLTSGLKYDTVGGTAGVAVYSHPIPVDPGGCYRVGYDIKGQGEPFVFVLGYWKCGPEQLKDLGEKILFKPVPGGPSFSLVAFGTSGEEKRQPQAGDFIQSYRRRIVARFPGGQEKTWRHYETVLQFPEDRPIQVALLELYAFWPPGEYWFDNIRVQRVTPADLAAYEAKRKGAGAEANFGTALP